MNTYVENSKEKKSHSIAHNLFQKKGRKYSGFQFVDNRPNAVAHEKTQEIVNNSSQAKQAAQLKTMVENYSTQQPSLRKRANTTGLPDHLKSGIENLSGYSMDDVTVHYNSDKPAQLQAHAYAQGTDIHLQPGQEKHLPHEAWHVVQQKQGRVKTTLQMKGGVNINDDSDLEKEADVMGMKAFEFVDNRPEAAAQRKIHELVNDSTSALFAPRKETLLNPDESDSESKQRINTPYFTNEGNRAPVQRVIDFSKKSKRVSATNIEELILFFVAKYGKFNEDHIRDKIKKIDAQEDNWSVFDVYRSFEEDNLSVFTEVEFSHSSSPNLPGGGMSDEKRYAAINQFAFNTVTKLVGIVGKNRFEARNDSDDDQHAEEIFMQQVDSSGIKLNEETVIVITINNSPCHAKCATLLAEWVKKHGLKDVTMFFANPYGTDEEFTNAIKILQAAGIKIHGFIPLDEIGTDTDNEIEGRYRKRFNKMGGKLKRAKKEKLYTSDNDSSSSEEEEEDSSDEDSDDEVLRYFGIGPHSDPLLERSRKYWIERIKHLVKLAKEKGNSDIDFEDAADEMGEIVDDPFSLEYISTTEDFKKYISEIDIAFDRCAKKMISSQKGSSINYNIRAESGIDRVIVVSIQEALLSANYITDRQITVVSGKNWTCYIRCVLIRLGKLSDYEAVIAKISEDRLNISSGVTVGEGTETQIQAIIESITGMTYYATATDVSHGHSSSSVTQHGTHVEMILTGAHFSLLG